MYSATTPPLRQSNTLLFCRFPKVYCIGGVYTGVTIFRNVGHSRLNFDHYHDSRVRGAVFQWLAAQVSLHGDSVPRKVLEQGFELGGKRVHVIGPQGIFKPAVMQVPISITTSPKGPYDDAIGPDNLLRYRYRGIDPDHPDNVGLRIAMERGLPLAYFHGIVPGKYSVFWPVFVVQDSPEDLVFSVVVDDALHTDMASQSRREASQISDVRRAYVTSLARRRLHQSAFRERVLRAYRQQCAFCRLRHRELLDAAHIIPDRDPMGEPVVSNGISLCRLHHAAFDKFFLGVRPDHVIQVRPDVLEEIDGPTLQHAIQGLHGQRIILPRKALEKPATEFLAERYERFLKAALTQ